MLLVPSPFFQTQPTDKHRQLEQVPGCFLPSFPSPLPFMLSLGALPYFFTQQVSSSFFFFLDT